LTLKAQLFIFALYNIEKMSYKKKKKKALSDKSESFDWKNDYLYLCV